MTDSIISLRIDKETLKKMRRNNEINWSAFLRNCLKQRIEEMQEKEFNFDVERAKKASENIDKIRKSGIFDGENFAKFKKTAKFSGEPFENSLNKSNLANYSKFSGGKSSVELIREWRNKRK